MTEYRSYGDRLTARSCPVMGVYAGPDPGQVAVGIAYPVGQVETRMGIEATIRLVVGKEEWG